MGGIFLFTSTPVTTVDWYLPPTNSQYDQNGQAQNCFLVQILTHKWNFYLCIIAHIFFSFLFQLTILRWKGLLCLQGQMCKVGEENVSFSLMLGSCVTFQFFFFACILWQIMLQLMRNLTDFPCYKTLSMICHSTLWTYCCLERRSLWVYIYIINNLCYI